MKHSRLLISNLIAVDNILNCIQGTHDIFDSNDVDNALKTEELKQKIIEECNLYFQESDKRWNMMMEELKKLDS